MEKLHNTETFNSFASGRRILTYGGFFEAFMATLPEDEQQKVNYGLLLLQAESRLSTRFVKHIEDGLFELRTRFENSCIRTFFIFDKGNVVVLFNGFRKKEQKTPRREIEKAKQIMKAYYERACK
ncbi:MAG: type II toxin-antitoxin system RelE/ParE family toxin [Bacteroidales bacterium]|nr:type II toxin-antitoxin system RelE/ParE family toxin [Bacteroidales bacterium]